MAKEPLTFTTEERELLITSLDKEIANSKRGQNTSKNPQFRELYRDQENKYQALKIKVSQA